MERDQSGRKAADPGSVLDKPKNGGRPTPDAAAPAPAGRSSKEGLIPIPDGPATIKPSTSADPYAYWSEYFRKHDETADQLHETVRLLNRNNKPRDVHAAVLGYLQHRRKNVEPWMYEALALAIEMNGGRPEDVKKSLDFAADLALRTHNPNHLISAADKLMLKGYYERVGPLIDESAAKIPHRAEPILMSINLAQQTKDPKRMADAVKRLLSVGWPGQDEYFRRESRKQVETLAKTLTEEGRADDAKSLLAILPDAEARDLYIRLTWDGNADYDLVVHEPLDATVTYLMPRSVFGGSLIQNGYGSHPDEVYVCPRGFDGDYTVRISMIYNDPKKPTTRLSLETITHEGTPEERKETISLVPDDSQAKPVVIHLKGGRRTTVLPFVSPMAVRQSVDDALGKKADTAKSTTPKAPQAAESKPRPIPVK
ncbi:MAG: hypothetical protein P4L85_10785 [Paludisphaera borealis]|uniref:hypothetical protein n=1 Tax=Paludisphaera borealis TaxID=1387353 RepID=UPI00284A938D|nr:hypothetical protein [Paludisphaera borealis]MDR3619824.1 hypothetical protein [Paludisphaera borealis]